MKHQWISDSVIQQDGIIVGSDLTQEWLLPWWWRHYRRFNAFPVTFVDFGMSSEMKEWCKEQGELITLPLHIDVADQQKITTLLSQKWEKILGREFWKSRNAWFKKPLACLQSPYRRTIWIDLDCEIRGPLKELFDLCENPSGLAIAKELSDPFEEQVSYNSGVLIFKYGIPVIETWAHRSLEKNHLFAGDQNVLSTIIQEEELAVFELPHIYNWSRLNEENPQAIICHWHGAHGKEVIAHQIMLHNLKSLDLLSN